LRPARYSERVGRVGLDVARRTPSRYDPDMESSPNNDAGHQDDASEEGLSAAAFDPLLEVFKRDIDFSLVERNLRLTTEERAQQLVNATRFIAKFRPLVEGNSGRIEAK
jgi:hypothetical protein